MVIAFLRTIILYAFIIAGIRLMGKRQVGELEPSELVLALLIADLAAVPMQDFGIPLLTGLIPILTLLCITMAVPEEMVDLSKVLLKLKIISHDGDIVNLNLPVQVAEPFIKNAKISGSDILQSIDFAQIIGLVKSGAVGKLLEINSADGDIVEICGE